MTIKVSLRAMTPADQPFLERLYASTRAEELALLDWDDAKKAAFLKMQFHAQHSFYQQQFPRAAFQIVLENKQPIGRLYLDSWAAEWNVLDIALVPRARGRGLGTLLMRDILRAAAAAGRPVIIHVERFNRARSLYDRLGFQQVADTGVYHLMKWIPATVAVSRQVALHDI